MIYAKPRIRPRKWDVENSLRFWDINGSSNLGQTTKNNKKKRACRIVDLAVPADHRGKFKESEKRDKYLNHTRELKNYESDGDTNS